MDDLAAGCVLLALLVAGLWRLVRRWPRSVENLMGGED